MLLGESQVLDFVRQRIGSGRGPGIQTCSAELISGFSQDRAHGTRHAEIAGGVELLVDHQRQRPAAPE